MSMEKHYFPDMCRLELDYVAFFILGFLTVFNSVIIIIVIIVFGFFIGYSHGFSKFMRYSYF